MTRVLGWVATQRHHQPVITHYKGNIKRPRARCCGSGTAARGLTRREGAAGQRKALVSDSFFFRRTTLLLCVFQQRDTTNGGSAAFATAHRAATIGHVRARAQHE
jgi:hypothetical protein